LAELSPISYFDGWCCKRDDMAGWVSLDYPSGSKWRQYLAMAKIQPGVPMIVGCSSYSCMQVYVAGAAKLTQVPSHIFVPDRKVETEATTYAYDMGAVIHLVPGPAWTTVLRKRARDKARELGQTVRWNPDLALKDTMEQCANVPDTVKRVVVPTGSGLTASGVLAGLALRHKRPVVVAVSVSSMARTDKIMQKAEELVFGVTGGLFNHHLPNFILKQVKAKYGAAACELLPDGTPLDPYYAAKAMPFIQPGDCLWVPGLRPLSAMPVRLRKWFADWGGFKS
jgi:hypothetical protein